VTEEGCVLKKSPFTEDKPYCTWIDDQTSCGFAEPSFNWETSLIVAIIVAVAEACCDIPMDFLFSILASPVSHSVGIFKDTGAIKINETVLDKRKTLVYANSPSTPRRNDFASEPTSSAADGASLVSCSNKVTQKSLLKATKFFGAQSNRVESEQVALDDVDGEEHGLAAVTRKITRNDLITADDESVRDELKSLVDAMQGQAEALAATSIPMYNKFLKQWNYFVVVSEDTLMEHGIGLGHNVNVNRGIQELMSQITQRGLDETAAHQAFVGGIQQLVNHVSKHGFVTDQTLHDCYEKHNREVAAQEIAGVMGLVADKQATLTRTSDAHRGVVIVHEFMLDLLGRDTAAAKIFANKADNDFKGMYHYHRFTKLVVVGIIVLINFGCIYYAMLKGFIRGESWQQQYLFACIFQLFLEVTLFETSVVLWCSVIVPQFVHDEVQTAFIAILKIISAMERTNQLLSGATAEQQGDKDSANEECDAADICFNAADYFFVSKKLAATYPSLIESIIVRQFESLFPPTGLQCKFGGIARVSNTKAKFAETSRSLKLPGQGAVLPAFAVLLSRRVYGAFLEHIATMPLSFQNFMFSVLQPLFYSGVIIFIDVCYRQPVLFVALFCGFVGLAMLIYYTVRYLSRKQDSLHKVRPLMPPNVGEDAEEGQEDIAPYPMGDAAGDKEDDDDLKAQSESIAMLVDGIGSEKYDDVSPDASSVESSSHSGGSHDDRDEGVESDHFDSDGLESDWLRPAEPLVLDMPVAQPWREMSQKLRKDLQRHKSTDVVKLSEEEKLASTKLSAKLDRRLNRSLKRRGLNFAESTGYDIGDEAAEVVPDSPPVKVSTTPPSPRKLLWGTISEKLGARIEKRPGSSKKQTDVAAEQAEGWSVREYHLPKEPEMELGGGLDSLKAAESGPEPEAEADMEAEAETETEAEADSQDDSSVCLEQKLAGEGGAKGGVVDDWLAPLARAPGFSFAETDKPMSEKWGNLSEKLNAKLDRRLSRSLKRRDRGPTQPEDENYLIADEADDSDRLEDIPAPVEKKPSPPSPRAQLWGDISTKLNTRIKSLSPKKSAGESTLLLTELDEDQKVQSPIVRRKQFVPNAPADANKTKHSDNDAAQLKHGVHRLHQVEESAAQVLEQSIQAVREREHFLLQERLREKRHNHEDAILANFPNMPRKKLALKVDATLSKRETEATKELNELLEEVFREHSSDVATLKAIKGSHGAAEKDMDDALQMQKDEATRHLQDKLEARRAAKHPVPVARLQKRSLQGGVSLKSIREREMSLLRDLPKDLRLAIDDPTFKDPLPPITSPKEGFPGFH